MIHYGKIIIFPAIVLAAYLVIIVGCNGYDTLPWLDIPFHAAGGVSIGYAGIILASVLRQRGHAKAMDGVAIWLFAVGMVALVALCWELFEFIMQLLFPPEQPMTLNDTMLDMLLGLLGGAGSAFWFTYSRARGVASR